MLMANVGMSGSGKTTMMVGRAYNFHKQGVKVYANMTHPYTIKGVQ